MSQKVVLKVISMRDEKTKQKAIEAAADIYGVDSIAANLKDQELTVLGEMDAVAVVKKLKKVAGTVDIVSVGPVKTEESPPDQKKKKRKKKKKKQGKKDEEKDNQEEDDEDLMEFWSD